MPYLAAAVDTTEPVSDTVWELNANQQLYGVIDGCALTFDATDMTVDIAAGTCMYNGVPTSVAVLANAVTLVTDASNPRFSWLGLNSSGVLELVSGTAAANPTVPELGDRTAVALVRIPANTTIASNATEIIKRIPYRIYGFKGTDIASAATLAYPTGGGLYYDVTGTTGITALPNIGTGGDGVLLILQFDASLTITHNATSLILQGAVNYVTRPGDVLMFINEDSGNWREIARHPVNAIRFVDKSIDETVNNSATLQNDDAFSFPLAANETYMIMILARISTGATSGFKYDWSVPAGATGVEWSAQFVSAAVVNIDNTASMTTDVGNTNAIQAMLYAARVAAAGTAGTAQFRWAQNAAIVGDTIVQAGSFMIIARL